MGVTKSFARFATGAYTADFQREQQRRRRSSYDTLVIPNRTRLPSSQISQVEPIDLQIAANLLNAQAHALPARPLSHLALNPPKTRQLPGGMTLKEGGEQPSRPPRPGSFYFNEAEDEFGAYQAGSFVHRHDAESSDQHQSSSVKRAKSSSFSSGTWDNHDLGASFDGANDLPCGDSRVISSAWPTGNDTAFHPLRSDPTYSVHEYNRLAVRYGLSPIAITPDYGKCPISGVCCV